MSQVRPGRSLNFKLGRMVVASLSVAAVSLAVSMCWREAERFTDARRDQMFATAAAFSAAVGKSVAANDAAAVRQALRAIGQVPGAVHAEVFDRGGRMLADLGGAARLSGDLDLSDRTSVSGWRLLGAHTVKVSVPVVDSGARIGELVLVSETGDLAAALRDVVTGIFGATALALGIGLAISLRLQRAITSPLIALTRTMGEIRRSHDYAATIAIESDDETGALASSFNGMIAEIQQRDRALVLHQQHLEHEVQERTADLKVAKLAAEEANEAKSRFLATMSHEIRTPMNGMLVMADLLARAELAPRERRYAQVISRSGQSLVAIINDILDLSKIEAGKLDLESIPLRVSDVTDTVIALFAERAFGKGLDLAAYVSPDAVRPVLGDPVRITQIVSNLVNNALKFTESGSVLVRVDASPSALRIEVSDTGVGIAEDKLETIFASFSQADQSTARRYGGTGLGLSICKTLAEAMNGSIVVASEVGRGSAFTVELPLVAADVAAATRPVGGAGRRVAVDTGYAATSVVLLRAFDEAGYASIGPDEAPEIVVADAAALRAGRPSGARCVVALVAAGDGGDDLLSSRVADRLLGWPVSSGELRDMLEDLGAGRDAQTRDGTPAAAATRTDPDLSSARVLVADDSAVNREVACAALRRFGIEAETVEDGRAAAALIFEQRFDLVLMDGSMPELDGFAATRLVRAHEASTARARTPIVALTAHVLGDDADAWIHAGMDGVLHKPLSLPKLEECLRRWLASDVPETRALVDRAPVNEAASQPGTDVLDSDTLEQLEQMAEVAGGGFIARVLGLFDVQADSALEALESAAVERDFRAAASAAHAFKSVALNIGGRQLAGRLAVMEMLARHGTAVPDAETLDELREILARTRHAVRRKWAAATAETAEAA